MNMTSPDPATSTSVPVSAVIPCYNCADTIRRAVESVAAQSARPSELFLITDASRDKTLEVLYELQKEFEDGWVQIFDLGVNSGAAVARNRGWEAAGHPYVAFLDADDTWDTRKIAIQYEWMTRNPDAMITGHRMRPTWKPYRERNSGNKFRVRRITRSSILIRNPFVTTSNVMVRSNLKLRFAPWKRNAQDYLLWAEAVCKDYPVYRLEKVLASYHKPLFGAGGLTVSMLRSQKAQLEVFRELKRNRVLPALLVYAAITVSLLKFPLRLFRSRLKGKANLSRT